MRPRTLPAWTAVAVAVLTLAALTLPAGADTEDRLADARDELKALEAQLQADRAAYGSMQEQLAATKVQVDEAEAAYRDLERRLADTRDGVVDAEQRYEEIRGEIGSMIRIAYMDGPAGSVGFLLGSDSQDEFADRLTYLGSTTDRAAYLADQATELATSLEARTEDIQQLLKDKDAVLRNLEDQKEQLKSATEQAEAALGRLISTQDEMLDLVVRLRRELAGPDLEWLQHAFQGEKSVPYGMWGEAFLAEVNAPDCRDNLVAMVAWQLNEGTSADWNPLATTYDMPGATAFNSFGVRNYRSLEQGLQATWLTLKRGWSAYGYAPIVQSLRRCRSAMNTAEAINASMWCRGCTYGRYVTGLISRVEDNYETYSKL